MKVGPAVGVSWIVYEDAKRRLGVWGRDGQAWDNGIEIRRGKCDGRGIMEDLDQDLDLWVGRGAASFVILHTYIKSRWRCKAVWFRVDIAHLIHVWLTYGVSIMNMRDSL